MTRAKLRARISKLRESTGATSNSLFAAYFLERFLYRLSLSEYMYKFAFKGGFLLEALTGVEYRATMDLDLRLSGSDYSDEELINMLQSICSIHVDDGITYAVANSSDIQGTEYGGERVKIIANLEKIKQDFHIDICQGDAVTPYPIVYRYKSIIDDNEFDIRAYNIESVIADKLHAIINRGTDSTRSKDLYDMYLVTSKGFDDALLTAAVINEFYRRDLLCQKELFDNVVDKIEHDEPMAKEYEDYIKKNCFAQDISYEVAIKAVRGVIDRIDWQTKLFSDSDDATHITMARHGEDDHRYGYGGWSDNALTENGVSGVYDLADRLDP
ncbi:MAG: nucleotidyl transferase AbiEii/AbiGii toxin family protein [Clostridia bacterium]|nr:nucleotidyl transferase AbiEii/AbiGii toxin family protein [Clostridia bacterium]